jgi:hypothetical protein
MSAGGQTPPLASPATTARGPRSTRGRLRSLETASLLRLGLYVLAGATLAGTVLELLFLQHWGGRQTLVWIGVIGIASSLALQIIRPARMRVLAARWLAIAVFAVAGLGLWFHLDENLSAGALDRQYADTWDSRPAVEQLWLAATGSVGPAPPMAPAVLAEMGFALFLASLRHPGLRPEATVRG